ncbi:hypothetical protein D9758_003898 [Tetrapyrgos nigripes]|uniref:Uncharacterized protein n=1 Tax=Tetrapyrgos nigripes TaxID=182062 RepID=A0A8H5GLL0_9AGAR|nr:hypothetical protein D9758_003898 [Tetrapyrgos nigripes]
MGGIIHGSRVLHLFCATPSSLAIATTADHLTSSHQLVVTYKRLVFTGGLTLPSLTLLSSPFLPTERRGGDAVAYENGIKYKHNVIPTATPINLVFLPSPSPHSHIHLVSTHSARHTHRPSRRDAFVKFSNDKNNEGEAHSSLKAPKGARVKSITVSKLTGTRNNDEDEDDNDIDEARLDVFWGDPITDQKEQATKAYIIIHGRLRDGATYWQTMSNVLQSAVDAGYPGADSKAFIIAPQFFSEVYNKGQYTSTTLAFADTNAWVAGDIATHPRGTSLTSFDALDSLLGMFSNKTEYPNLTNVTLVGHGGGGQMVARYAMVGNADEVVNEVTTNDNNGQDRHVHVRYLIGDPSTQAYFTTDRPVAMEVMGMSKRTKNKRKSSDDEEPNKSDDPQLDDNGWEGGDPSCEWWNTWRYGFDGFNYTTFSGSDPTFDDPSVVGEPDPNTGLTGAVGTDPSSYSPAYKQPNTYLSPATLLPLTSAGPNRTYPSSPIALFSRYVSRDIVLILGLNDTKPNGDQYCPALLQGGYARVYRNLAWWSYVNTLARTKEPVQMLLDWVNAQYQNPTGVGDDDKKKKRKKDDDDKDSSSSSSSHHSHKHHKHHKDDDDEDSGSSSQSLTPYQLRFDSLPNWSNVTYKSGIAPRLIIVEDAGHDAEEVLSGMEGRSALFLSGVPVDASASSDGTNATSTGAGASELLIGWRPEGWNETTSDCSMCDESTDNLGREGSVEDAGGDGINTGNSSSPSPSSSHSGDDNGARALGGMIEGDGRWGALMMALTSVYLLIGLTI